MLSKKFLHISNSSIAQQQLFKTQAGLMLPSLNKSVKERRGSQNAAAAAARSQIDPRVGKRRRRRRRYLVGWKKFFFQVWEQKKQKQQQDLRMSRLQPKGSEANFSLPSFLLQQGRNNTSLHLQIEKNGRRDSRILSFASEQPKKQQKQQRRWLALHEFQVPPRRSQAAGRKGCSSFRVLAGVWLRAARRGEVRTCAPGEEEEQQQEQEQEQECKGSFGEEAWLFLLCRRASDLCGRE
jgi:hypothetical protein